MEGLARRGLHGGASMEVFAARCLFVLPLRSLTQSFLCSSSKLVGLEAVECGSAAVLEVAFSLVCLGQSCSTGMLSQW